MPEPGLASPLVTPATPGDQQVVGLDRKLFRAIQFSLLPVNLMNTSFFSLLYNAESYGANRPLLLNQQSVTRIGQGVPGNAYFELISGERLPSEQTYEQVCPLLDQSFRQFRLEQSVLLPGNRAFQVNIRHLKRVQINARNQAILFIGAKELTVEETFDAVQAQLTNLFLMLHRPQRLYATNNQLLIHPNHVDFFDQDTNAGETRIAMTDGQRIDVMESLLEIEQQLEHCQLR